MKISYGISLGFHIFDQLKIFIYRSTYEKEVPRHGKNVQ